MREGKNTSSINWEQRRYEIAKEMLSALYVDEGNEARMQKNKGEIFFEYQDLESTAREAVRFADALIKQLKK